MALECEKCVLLNLESSSGEPIGSNAKACLLTTQTDPTEASGTDEISAHIELGNYTPNTDFFFPSYSIVLSGLNNFF